MSLIRKIKELDEVIHIRELPFDDKEGFGDLEKRLRDRLTVVGRERLAREHEEDAAVAADWEAAE